jgi:hypothetical protein
MRVSADIIGSALNAHYEGMSCNAVRRYLKQTHGYYPSDFTVYEWVAYFTSVIEFPYKNWKEVAIDVSEIDNG